ncbi:MAG: hypothetical protein JJE53_00345 [Candidatus Pacebacteria bacterium]|nr:hypothetical protein [Candidatus Paceibacterota bacterium]
MEENKKQPNNKVLRTYTSDMADAIRTNEMSVIKIALAEKEKREQEQLYKEAEGTNTSKTFLIIGGVLLIAAAIFGSYFLIQKRNETQAPVITKEIDTFITYDSYSNIDASSVKNINDLSTIVQNVPPVAPGLIKALFLATKNLEVSQIITSKNFLTLTGASVPGALTRSLSDKYLLGKYSNKNILSGGDGSTVFLIFQTTDYNQAYASMLDWEGNLLKDLNVLFGINITESNYSLLEKKWSDIVVNNKDARVLYGLNGEDLLYYVFVNKNNFVITSNIETLKEVISRLLIKNV